VLWVLLRWQALASHTHLALSVSCFVDAQTADTPRIFNTGAILQRPIFTVLGLRECKW
jgi:hypothetical protein